MGNWTEDTTAILLGFVIILLALAAFLLVPYSQVDSSLLSAQTASDFSVDAWSADNDPVMPLLLFSVRRLKAPEMRVGQ